MRKSILFSFAVLALLLAACQPGPQSPGAATPQLLPTREATLTTEPTTMPTAPAAATETPVDQPAVTSTPEGETPVTGEQPLESSFPPLPDDDDLVRGNFFVDSINLIAATGAASMGAMDLHVEGSLPTPCHEPRAVVHSPDENGRIVVELYSVVEPDVMCTQVIEPFSGTVATLEGLPAGTYSVMVNDLDAGELTVQ